MNGWVMANAIFCFACVFSTTTDFSSGAAYTYAPNRFYVIMVPEDVTETPTETKKREVRSYIMANYRNIEAGLGRIPKTTSQSMRRGSGGGTGEYVRSLLEVLEITDTGDTLQRLKSLSEDAENAMGFSDTVLAEFVPEAAE